MNVSYRTLEHGFRRAIGRSVHQEIRNVRMRRTAELLRAYRLEHARQAAAGRAH